MAKYKYLGPTPRSYVKTWGTIKTLVFRLKDGTTMSLVAPNQARGFKSGDIVTLNQDVRMARALAADTRFELVA